MRQLVQRETEGCAPPGSEGWLNLDQRTVNGSGRRTKTPVNALQCGLFLGLGQVMACDLLGENDRWRRLALDARREDLFGEDSCASPGESADQTGKCAFENGAFADSALFRGHGQ